MGKKKAVKKQQPFQVGAGYGWTTMSVDAMTEKFKKVTEKVAALQANHKIDALAFAGSSGCAIAFILSVALQIPLIYVRKEGEKSHGSDIEGNAWKGVTKYLIVDDFIDEGNTMNHIYDKINDRAKSYGQVAPECVGIFLYFPYGLTHRFCFNDDVVVPVFR